MEALPSSLLYFTQQIANFTRNQIKINPLNTNKLESNGPNQLRVSLPVNSIANMKSLTMHCKMTVKAAKENPAGAGNAKGGLIPRGGAAAVFERVTFSSGGVALDNGATPYYAVQAVRENLKKGSQKYMSDDCVLQQAVIEKHEDGAITADGKDQVKQLAVTNFGGFPECEPCFLDLNLVPEIQMTIQIAPKFVVPFQWQGKDLGEDTEAVANSNQCEYALEDIHFSLEVIQIGSGIYDALVQRIMAERGSLDVPYPQFQVFSSQSSKSSSTGSVSCMSLDRIMVTTRSTTAPNNYQVQTYARGPVPGSKTWSHTQLATKFSTNGAETWQMQVNNAPRPLYRVDSGPESFAIAVNADDRSYSHSRGGLVSSQDMWKDYSWAAVQRLKFDEDPRRLSGLNLSSINSQLAYTPQYPSGSEGTGAEVLMITEQTSILRIGGGRSIAVVA